MVILEGQAEGIVKTVYAPVFTGHGINLKPGGLAEYVRPNILVP